MGVPFQNTPVPDEDEKPPEEWVPAERRAYILERIKEEGHPDHLNQSNLADKFDVDKSRISRDINNHIAEWMAENIGQRAELVTKAVFDNAIKAAMEDEEYGAAVSYVKDWNEYLFDSGAKERAPDKAEIKTADLSEDIDNAEDLDDETMDQLDQLRDGARDSVSTESLADDDGESDGLGE